MLRENSTIVVAKNERWTGEVATEPVECGWATEAIFFARSLGGHGCAGAEAAVQLSPDGMNWVSIDAPTPLPEESDAVMALPVKHFGNWLRLVATIPAGGEFVALVTLHLK